MAALKNGEECRNGETAWEGHQVIEGARVASGDIAKAVGKSVSPTLGVAWCRRTWCNHLVLDFLAVHPALNDPVGGYRGLGSAMFIGIAVVAGKINCHLVWGEATESSCTFYQKLLGGTPVLDHFFFGSEALATLRSQLQLRTKIKPQSKP